MPVVIKRSELDAKKEDDKSQTPQKSQKAKSQAASDAGDNVKAFLSLGVIVVIVLGGILWLVFAPGGSSNSPTQPGTNTQATQSTDKSGGEGLSALQKKKGAAGAEDN